MIKIYYDAECPFCNNYIQYQRLQQAVGDVELIDLRENLKVCQRFKSLGYDVDDGMIVDYLGKLYFGSKALSLLANLSDTSSSFGALNKALFGSEKLSRLMYPILKIGRRATLFMLNRKSIVPTQSQFLNLHIIFALFFGIFVAIHCLTNAFHYTHGFTLIRFILLFLGCMLIFRPQDQRIFFSVLGFLAIDSISLLPSFSNHTILKNFLLITTWTKT